MSEMSILNLSIGLSGLWLCLLGILHIRIGIQTDAPTKRYFLLSYFTLILFDGANLSGQLMRGQPGPLFRAGLYLSNFIEFLAPVVLVYIVTVYLLSLVDPKKERLIMRTVSFALIAAHALLLIIAVSGEYPGFRQAGAERRRG